MINQVKIKSKNYWNQWINNRTPLTNPQILGSNNIYILPSGLGWIYGLIVLTLCSGAINYQISTLFLMTFLMAVIGLTSAWEAHSNLKDLSVQLISVEDTPQGKPAQVTLLIQSNTKTRFGVVFQIANQPVTRIENIPPEGMQFILPVETTERGCFALPRIKISSLYPFGIFKVWGYARFDLHYYVYPSALSPDFWPPPVSNQQGERKNALGDEEFFDLKQVENPWVQPNLIAWKIAAKGQGWYLKTRDNTEEDYWQFKLNDLPMQPIEIKLQNLCYWLLTAEQNGLVYSLDLTQNATPFDRGEHHLRRCLRQLAVFK
ncbi:transmembrane protein [Legionella moravica]|uniref:Transmembrane protein n=1 Tax=Legionella moravica TaxID=39962 RepID=A0A378JW78_9GAMM|nr:membrane protein [Legionella moravica]KTD31630.1 transmembrane protein [Legionella moravica]STX62290.1 transmembrane protein [Legionella moravica]